MHVKKHKYSYTVQITTRAVRHREKGEAIAATGCRGPQGCEKLRLPHFPTDDDKLVSFMRRSPFTPRKILLPVSVRG
jgi:hypothetical protein